MQFVYVYTMMFLSIFGLAALIHLLWRALCEGASRRFEIFVRNDENIEELLENADKNPNIGRINIIADSADDRLLRLAEKYSDVRIVGGKKVK